MRSYTTQMDAARKGIVTPQMKVVAEKEHMPLEQLIVSFGEFLPFIKTKLDVVLFNALPFNILKGLVIGAIAMMIYKKLTPILKGETLK